MPVLASAAPLEVTPSGGDLAACTNGDPCSLIRAVVIAEPVEGETTIHISAGTITLPPTGLDATGSAFEDLSIKGSGQRLTTITGSPGAQPLIAFGAPGISLSDVAIEASGVPTGETAVSVIAGSALFDHTSFDVEGAPGHFAIHGASDDGVDVEVANSELEDQVTGGGGPEAPGATVQVDGEANGSLDVHDSTFLLRDSGSRAEVIRAVGASLLTADKNVIAMHAAVPADRGDGQGFAVRMDPALTGNADARVADSIIIGGGGGVWAAANGIGYVGSHLNVDVDRTTIDVGDVGVVDPLPRLDIQLGGRDEGTIDMGVRDSVFLDPVKRYDVGGFKCYSPAFANYTVAIAVTACNSLVIFNDNPTTIFPAATEGDLLGGGISELRSRAIEAFTPVANSVILDNATGVGAPATDIAGLPRVAVGKPNCPKGPIMDRGAVERPGPSEVVCPPPDPPPAPVISHLHVSPTSPRQPKARRAKFVYRLDRDATVRLTLIGPSHGKRAILARRTYSDEPERNEHQLGQFRKRGFTPGAYRLKAAAFVGDSKSAHVDHRFRILRR